MKDDFAKCPICKQDVISDAYMLSYCKLCGMAIKEKWQEFCCLTCEDKFKKFRGV